MRKNFAVLFAAVLSAALAWPSAARAAQPKYKIRWLIGHPNLDFFEEAAQTFKRTVESESKGEVSVEVVTENDGGTQEPAIAAAVAKGDAEMGHSFTDVMGEVDHRLWAFQDPYLFRDYRHMEGVIEGPLGGEMLQGMRARGIEGLSFTYSGGANEVASMDKELRAPEDFKGLRVGVCHDDAVNAAWLKALGAVPVAVGHDANEGVPASWHGKLDAVVVTWRNFARGRLDQQFRYMNMPGSSYLVSVTYVNQKYFESLPAQYQALIKRASRDAGRVERAKTIELNETSKQMMTAKGVLPTYLSAKAQARFVKALAPAYREIESVLGKSLVEKIRKTPDGASPQATGVLTGR